MPMRLLAEAVSLAALVTAVTACGGESNAAQLPASKKSAQAPATRYTDGADSMRFVDHSENLPVGLPTSRQALSLTNPYEGNKQAVATGAQLFISYNCIDCHGADGSGAMGPALSDGRWHFGGSPAEVFESIYQGRPDGMPSWGGRITNDQIWMLTAYVRSLSTKDVSTENFSGKTIERTGH